MIWRYMHTFVFCLVLDFIERLELSDVHSELQAAQSSVQAVVYALNKFNGGRHLFTTVASQSMKRRRRRQASLRQLYAASHGDLVPSEDKETRMPSL